MSDKITIRTNSVPRPLINGWELTEAERAEFDYHDWAAIDEGTDSAEFFRYRGDLYDLANFTRISSDGDLAGWEGVAADSFFSGTLIRFPLVEPANRWHAAEYDYESVVVGTYYC